MLTWRQREKMTNRCVVCDREYELTTRPRYICCNGRDCGCHGARLSDEVCSLACFEQRQNREASEDERRRLRARIAEEFIFARLMDAMQ